MAAMAPATASRPWPLPRVLLNIPADASRLALLQPAARVDRVAVAAQFEIQRRPALAAGIADAGDRTAALALRPGVLEQGRSDERRVGRERVSTCSSRSAPHP